MNLASCFLILVMLAAPLRAMTAPGAGKNSITLTANQVDGAEDIEIAINQVTQMGTRAGTVILDGRKGAFVYTGDDKSLNLFVSNLTLRGVNDAVVQNCDDGLFFDDFSRQHILVEGIAFLCSGDGVDGIGDFQDVVLRDNIFQAGLAGITVGGGNSGWVIRDNLIQAGGDAIRMVGGQNLTISDNHLSGNLGVALLACTQAQVRHNAIQAAYQGVLLGQETSDSFVQANTILGVSASGIAMEPGAVGNRVLANRVTCASGTSCQAVDASPEVAEMNKIAGNRP